LHDRGVLDALKPLADQGRVLKKNFRSGTPKGTLRNELSKLIVAFFVRHPDATNKEALEYLQWCGDQEGHLVTEVVPWGADWQVYWAGAGTRRVGKREVTGQAYWLWSTIEKKLPQLRKLARLQ
jgi:hypothetical protein